MSKKSPSLEQKVKITNNFYPTTRNFYPFISDSDMNSVCFMKFSTEYMIDIFEKIIFSIDKSIGEKSYKSITIMEKLDNSNNSNYYVLYTINNNNSLSYVSEWKLKQMPGCCGLVVSTGAHVNRNFRDCGLGTTLSSFREVLSIKLGYSAMICTDVDKNKPQISILKKNGWKNLYNFKNKKTGNNINIHVKDLSCYYEVKPINFLNKISPINFLNKIQHRICRLIRKIMKRKQDYTQCIK